MAVNYVYLGGWQKDRANLRNLDLQRSNANQRLINFCGINEIFMKVQLLFRFAPESAAIKRDNVEV